MNEAEWGHGEQWTGASSQGAEPESKKNKIK